MYQPRRVADPIAPASPSVPARASRETDRFHQAPRHAAPTLADRVFARGGIALAVVTASATAGAVVVGSGADSAAAAGGTPVLAPVAEAVEVAAPPQMTGALTAEGLTTPALSKSKVAAKALVSLTPMYTTTAVNVRKAASDTSDLVATLDLGIRVSATATIKGKYRLVEYADGYGWVLESGLTESAPIAAAGTTWDPCPRGSAVERRLRKDTVHIYRSVCALFPAVNSYGGWRAGGLPFHKNGRALDIMLTPHAESALGHRIADYLIAHAKVFNINHIIFEQHIWTPQNPHWRKMADRGSITANHFNHVHVAINA